MRRYRSTEIVTIIFPYSYYYWALQLGTLLLHHWIRCYEGVHATVSLQSFGCGENRLIHTTVHGADLNADLNDKVLFFAFCTLLEWVEKTRRTLSMMQILKPTSTFSHPFLSKQTKYQGSCVTQKNLRRHAFIEMESWLVETCKWMVNFCRKTNDFLE